MFNSVEDLTSLLCNEWKQVLRMDDVDWENIIDNLNNGDFYPSKRDIFNALNRCHPDNVKVVIIGQDPYFNKGQAHGFSFSVRPNIRVPPSLMNIFKELVSEFGLTTYPANGCLEKWASEGVLLLNSILTVGAGKANSHKGIGWETFTSNIIEYVDNHCTAVFLAWGRQAQTVCSCVKKNPVIVSGHPSPMNTSNPFVGCGCFRKANDILIEKGILPVRWNRLWIK